MVMGIFYRHDGEWKFNAIGEPTSDRTFDQTLNTVRQKYL
jgi:tellurium resistance protein TerZ